MPRMGRVILPNHPRHVVQRGNNRQAVFAGDADLVDLKELKNTFNVRVYGFCLMTNHVHLFIGAN